MSLPRDIAGDADTLFDWLAHHAVGVARAKRATAIQRELGFNDRYVRLLAKTALEQGHLVCTGNAGYFVPANREECQETIGRLRSQAFEMLDRAKRLEREADDHFDTEPAPQRSRTPLFDRAHL